MRAGHSAEIPGPHLRSADGPHRPARGGGAGAHGRAGRHGAGPPQRRHPGGGDAGKEDTGGAVSGGAGSALQCPDGLAPVARALQGGGVRAPIAEPGHGTPEPERPGLRPDFEGGPYHRRHGC